MDQQTRKNATQGYTDSLGTILMCVQDAARRQRNKYEWRRYKYLHGLRKDVVKSIKRQFGIVTDKWDWEIRTFSNPYLGTTLALPISDNIFLVLKYLFNNQYLSDEYNLVYICPRCGYETIEGVTDAIVLERTIQTLKCRECEKADSATD